MLVLLLLMFALMLWSHWRIFAQVGQPGWAAIVPLYNLIVALRIARMSPWWLAALLTPYVGLIALLPLSIRLARRYGHSTAFGVGLWTLPFVFYPVLAFASPARHHGRNP